MLQVQTLKDLHVQGGLGQLHGRSHIMSIVALLDRADRQTLPLS